MPAVATDRISAIQMQFIKRAGICASVPRQCDDSDERIRRAIEKGDAVVSIAQRRFPLIVVPIKLLLTTLPLELPKMRTPSRPLAEIVLISVNGPVVEISPPTVFFDEFSMVMPSRLLGRAIIPVASVPMRLPVIVCPDPPRMTMPEPLKLRMIKRVTRLPE